MSAAAGGIVSLPSLLPTILPVLGVGAAAAGAVAGAYVAYRMIDQLQKDFQAGLEEFKEREAAEVSHLESQQQEQQETSTRTAALVERMDVAGVLDANQTFLLHRLSQLAETVAPLENAALREQCEQLRAEIARGEQPLETQLEMLRRLAEDVSAAVLPTTSAYEAQFDAIHDEIRSPLLASPQLAGLRKELQDQLVSLKKVGIRQRAMAKQGLSLLRQRVYREMQQQAELQQARQLEAEARRLLVGVISAKLHALSRLTDLPAFAVPARRMQQKLAGIIATGGESELDELAALGRETDYLFETCERTLQQHLVTEYISDQISDVLVSLGYQVQSVEEEGGERLIANIDNAVGIQFNVAEEGKLGAEMVALNAEAAAHGQESQEKICSIIDQVFAGLKGKDLPLRERFRSKLKPGEQLKVVETSAEEATEGDAAAAPKEMKIEG
ncbi:MAG: hypothetical protein ACYC6A_18090 [Armatimonadota bacterium]